MRSQVRNRVRALMIGLGIVWLALPAMANTYYVRQAGNDTADGKTAGSAFRTVLRAAQVLNHGDSLVIGPGQYRESVFLAERFDVEDPGLMFCSDSVELWIEEEQFGLGLIRDGSAHLFKYRFYNRAGQEWSANYEMPADSVWGTQLDDLSAHPLGRQLADICGVTFKGRKGYAVMGRMPMEELKLVGGIAGRSGVTDMTGEEGEIIRIGVAFSGLTAWGRAQDYTVYWPSSMMFSDPTRSAPFALGR